MYHTHTHTGELYTCNTHPSNYMPSKQQASATALDRRAATTSTPNSPLLLTRSAAAGNGTPLLTVTVDGDAPHGHAGHAHLS